MFRTTIRTTGRTIGAITVVITVSGALIALAAPAAVAATAVPTGTAVGTVAVEDHRDDHGPGHRDDYAGIRPDDGGPDYPDWRHDYGPCYCEPGGLCYHVDPRSDFWDPDISFRPDNSGPIVWCGPVYEYEAEMLHRIQGVSISTLAIDAKNNRRPGKTRGWR